MSNINTTSSSDFPESNKGMHYETRCGELIKVLWHDGIGMCSIAKRLERGRFIWPTPEAGGVVSITVAQLGLYAGRHRLANPAADVAAALGRLSSYRSLSCDLLTQGV